MTQEQRRIETRKNILAAAQEVFASRGFTDSGVEDICRQAGITKGAFYHHFATKQQLLMELLGHWIDEVADKIDPEKLKTDNALQLLAGIIKSIEPAFADARGQLPIFLELYIKGLKDPDLKKINKKSYDKFLSFFTGIAQEGIRQGSIKAEDGREVAMILFSLTIGFLIQGLLNPRGANWTELTQKSVRMMLQ
ncbi:MAG: TetR/AcrR family transcriptional regulator [Actinomycetota bacterium]